MNCDDESLQQDVATVYTFGKRLLGVREEAVIKEEDKGAGTIVITATALSMETIILGMPASF